MDILSAALLGLIQGITEFLPVSSSGHLILARDLFQISSDNALEFDVFLHLATLLAIIFYFASDLVKIIQALFSQKSYQEKGISQNYLWFIILGAIPAGVIGFFFGSLIEDTLRGSRTVALALLAGSLLFWLAERAAKYNKTLTPRNSVLIGFFQSLAFIPGMSRSGGTISGGLILGLNRSEAVRFSFLVGIPIMLGAGLKSIIDLPPGISFSAFGLPVFIGGVVAFASGLASIYFLVRYLKGHSLNAFIIYRIALALVILLVL